MDTSLILGAGIQEKSSFVNTVKFYIFQLRTLADHQSLINNCKTSTKAGPEVFFFQGLQKHDGQVWSTSAADFLVVPIPFGCLAALGKGYIAQASLKELERHKDFSWALTKKLLFFTTYYKGWRLLFSSGSISNRAIVVTITSTRKKRGRCFVSAPFLRVAHDVLPSKLGDRKFNLFFMGQADRRRAYTSRRVALQRLSGYVNCSSNVLVDTSGSYSPCKPDCLVGCSLSHSKEIFAELLSKSTWSLMVRGDLPTSSRLYDAIYFGVLNIIISDDLPRVGLPFREKVPWETFTIKVREKTFLHDPVAEISKVLQLSPLHVGKMLSLQNLHKKDYLWDVNGSKVVENVLESVRVHC